MATILIGLDVGQHATPTALAVGEVQWRRVGGQVWDAWTVRHLERLPLGTAYPDVARRVATVLAGVRQRGGRVAALYADATGLGQPVLEVVAPPGVRLTPVYFTYGDRRLVHEDHTITLGKAWLVSRLQALLQTGRVLLPRTPDAQTLAHDLLAYQVRVAPDANEHDGAFAVGPQDDLITALGLAVQCPPQRPGTYAAQGPHPLLHDPVREYRQYIQRVLSGRGH